MIIRPATRPDAPEMQAIQNAIIRIGGTTAYEEPQSPEVFAHGYLTGPDALSCHLAEKDGRVIGFQVLGWNADLPDGWADIGTFVDPAVQRSGAGAALFAASVTVARARGITTLNATIRVDNVPGLGYYARRGFVDYDADPEYRLSNGTRVGRVHKRFDLG